jgi:phage shock protein E
MKWTLLALAVVVVAAIVITLRSSPRLPPATAREQLQHGALLVDVRTAEEFNARHLAEAINIPLAELKEKLPTRVPDKSRVLLLHCRSGRRSGVAEAQLRALGYTNSFNVGSYQQAERIVNDARR